MSYFSKSKLGAVLGALIISLVSASEASAVVVDWGGFDSFNGTTAGSGDDTTFAGFTANQLTLITGTGTYEASRDSNDDPVNTAFVLYLRLNGNWTAVDTWNTSSTTEQLLSGLSTPINFTTSTVTGIALTANPPGTDFDPTFDNFFHFFRDSVTKEEFTFGVSSTPLPAALPLLASGLGAFGLLAGRRRRRTVS